MRTTPTLQIILGLGEGEGLGSRAMSGAQFKVLIHAAEFLGRAPHDVSDPERLGNASGNQNGRIPAVPAAQ
jgi:hypothetical protein